MQLLVFAIHVSEDLSATQKPSHASHRREAICCMSILFSSQLTIAPTSSSSRQTSKQLCWQTIAGHHEIPKYYQSTSRAHAKIPQKVLVQRTTRLCRHGGQCVDLHQPRPAGAAVNQEIGSHHFKCGSRRVAEGLLSILEWGHRCTEYQTCTMICISRDAGQMNQAS